MTILNFKLNNSKISNVLKLGNNNHKKTIFFSKLELTSILSLYSKQVSRGFWKDYALDSQNATAIFGGNSSPACVSCTEEYDGATWSGGGSLTCAQMSRAGTGTLNAALAIGGGQNPGVTQTEEYDGSNWATGGTLNQGRGGAGAAGTQNAAVAFGGTYRVSNTTYWATCTEEYDGTNWTNQAASLNLGRGFMVGIGTQNAALAAGGYNVPIGSCLSCVDEYDGASWSVVSTLNQGRSFFGGGGTQNDALVFGGCVPSPVLYRVGRCTEQYDGISWSHQPGLLVKAVKRHTGTGTTTNALSAAGFCQTSPSPTLTAVAEEYNLPMIINSGSFTTFTYSQNDGDVEVTGSFDIDLNRIDSTTGTFSIKSLPSDNTSTDHLVINSSGIVGKGTGNFNGATLAGPIYRSVTNVSIVNDTASFDFSVNDNFILDAGQDYKFDWVVTSDNIGQSGTILINNTADSTPDVLPSITKTPDGADILFVTGSNTTSVLSYYVAATDKLLVSYIGNFA